ncbi:MAG: PadR family transcriptional regulator [Gemmatimonadaceae bacterium]
MPDQPPAPSDAFLPLPVAEFHILVTLADGSRHGYGIMTDVERRTAGGVRIGPGTLYSALRRMVDRGLITEASTREGQEEDRRLSYRITALGRDVVVAEARRMEACLALIRATRLVSRMESA